MERTGLWNKVDFRKKTEPYSIIHVFRIHVLKYSAFPLPYSLFCVSYSLFPMDVHPSATQSYKMSWISAKDTGRKWLLTKKLLSNA
jgi:hypothetical protein